MCDSVLQCFVCLLLACKLHVKLQVCLHVRGGYHPDAPGCEAGIQFWVNTESPGSWFVGGLFSYGLSFQMTLFTLRSMGMRTQAWGILGGDLGAAAHEWHRDSG